MSSPPSRHDSIYTGDQYDHLVRCRQSDGITPIDLTGYTFRAQLREYALAADPPLTTFTVSLSGAATLGDLLLQLSPTQTTALRDVLETAVADLELTAPGSLPRTVMRLDLDIDPDVSR